MEFLKILKRPNLLISSIQQRRNSYVKVNLTHLFPIKIEHSYFVLYIVLIDIYIVVNFYILIIAIYMLSPYSTMFDDRRVEKSRRRCGKGFQDMEGSPSSAKTGSTPKYIKYLCITTIT